jgi:stage V sporulation protein B
LAEKIERGTFLLVSSNGFSFAANYLIYFFLGRLLIGPELLGAYAVVISIVGIIEMVLVKSVQQSVSKFVSEDPSSVQIVRKKAALLMILFGVALFIAYFALSGFIAAAFGDTALTPFIQLTALLLLLHPVFSVFTGCMNGLNLFVTQSKLRAFYAALKLVFIVSLAYLNGLAGAIAGFVLASFVSMLAGFFLTRGKAQPKAAAFNYKRFVAFMAPIFVFSIILDLLITIDLFAVKALAGEQSGLLAGYYAAAATIAKIFPMVISAIAFAVFPLVSAATFQRNLQKTRFYISNTMRYCLLIIAPVAFLFASTPAELISLIYPESYLPGAAPLPVLCFAFAIYTLFIIEATIIAAANRPRTAMAISIAALSASAVLNALLVPTMLLAGAALATLAGSTVGLILAGIFILHKFKILVSAKSALKIIAGSLLIYLISFGWPAAGLLLVAKYAVLLLIYALALLLLRDLTKRDLRVFLNMIR